MKKIEITIVSIILVAIILQACSIEGGLLLNTLCSLILALFYFFLGSLLLTNIGFKNMFKREAYKGVKWHQLFFAFIACITYITMLCGILFKLSRWDGATILLKAGLILSSPILVMSLIKYIPKPSKYYFNILIRSGIFIATGAGLLIFS